MLPPHHIERSMFDPSQAVGDLDQIGALGTCLANLASLQHSREDHVGIRAEDRGLMLVAEPPVVIAMVNQLIEAAWGVAHAIEASVQKSDVVKARDRLGVGNSE